MHASICVWPCTSSATAAKTTFPGPVAALRRRRRLLDSVQPIRPALALVSLFSMVLPITFGAVRFITSVCLSQAWLDLASEGPNGLASYR